MAAAYAELARRAAGDPRWEVRRLALSDTAGPLALGTTDNFASALPVVAALVAVPGGGARLGGERPRRAPRQRGARPSGPGAARLFKLDVQGYELRVLAGAAGMLAAVGVVETELSVVPLYQGQPLLADMVRALDEAGFALAALEPILRDWRTGEHLQFDGVFVRD